MRKNNSVIDSHSYVINPQHIHKFLTIFNEHKQIEHPLDNFRPIDMILADVMNARINNHNNHHHTQVFLPYKLIYLPKMNIVNKFLIVMNIMYKKKKKNKNIKNKKSCYNYNEKQQLRGRIVGIRLIIAKRNKQ